MNAIASRWQQIYREVPLAAVPSHFAGISNSPFLFHNLAAVLRLAPRGGRTLETGIGSGYGAIWLSLRGLNGEGIDYSRSIVERARQINGIMGGTDRFETDALVERGIYWIGCAGCRQELL